MKKSAITLAFILVVRMAFAQHLELKTDLLMPFFKTASLGLEMTTDDDATSYQWEMIYKGGVEGYSVSVPILCIGDCYPFVELPNTLDILVLMPSVRHYISFDKPKNAGWFIGAYLRSDILLFRKKIQADMISITGYNRGFKPAGSDMFLRNALGITMGNKWVLNENLFVEVGIGFDYEPYFQDLEWEDFMTIPSCKVSYRVY
ncbi:MAG: DUF3575 domain-containing protein [Saprospiraceae bacterium]|nr:DUF3575 domain-containing protein [Saprospiraceae bacterium]